MSKELRAEEFLLKYLFQESRTDTTSYLSYISYIYYDDPGVWDVKFRKTTGIPYHRLKLPVTLERFEQLLELLGGKIVKDTSIPPRWEIDTIHYGGRVIGFYTRHDSFPISTAVPNNNPGTISCQAGWGEGRCAATLDSLSKITTSTYTIPDICQHI